MKKLLVALAIAAGLSLGVSAPAIAAPMHHTTPTYTVTCDTTTWTYTVSLGVLNSEGDKVMTVTSVTGSSLITVGDTVDKGLTRVYSVTGVTAPYSETLDYDVSWPNGVTAHGHAELVPAAFPACVAPTPTPTPTPTVTPTPTPPVVPPTTPPTSTPHAPELAATGPNPLAIFTFFIAGVILIAVGLVFYLFLRPRKPRHSTKD